jgi:hypothetical protein
MQCDSYKTLLETTLVVSEIVYTETKVFITMFLLFHQYFPKWGHTVGHLVETLRYRPKGRGLDSQWGLWEFSLT